MVQIFIRVRRSILAPVDGLVTVILADIGIIGVITVACREQDLIMHIPIPRV